MKSTSTFPSPQVGSVGTFADYPRWGIKGQARILDERTINIENFYLTGAEMPVEIRLQKDSRHVATLIDLTGQTFDDANFELKLPESVDLGDFNVLTIFSPTLGAPLSGAAFD